jgi:hypothetical protein
MLVSLAEESEQGERDEDECEGGREGEREGGWPIEGPAPGK